MPKRKGAIISRVLYVRQLILKKTRTAVFLAQYFAKKFVFIFKKRLPHIKQVYVNSFPAIHLRKLDFFDYFFNFSSELLVISLGFLIVFSNFVFLGVVKHREIFADQSLASKFLSLHAQFNPKLYVHNTAVRTEVIASSAGARYAFADDTTLPGSGDANFNPQNHDDITFEHAISKPLASPKDLMAQAITVYKTEAGDSLNSVAKKFEIADSRYIAWSNNLSPNQTIKAGWYLIIPPQNGVVIHKTTADDTIPGLAKKYSVDEDIIITANSMEDRGDIEEGLFLYIPGGSIKEAPKPAPKPSPPTKHPSRPIYTEGNPFPRGQCTWYVASQAKVYWRGNAKDWLRNAAAAGAVITNQPIVGSIAATPDNRRYGHVAMVRAVFEDGTVLLEDYNYSARQKHGTHVERVSRVLGFIIP